MLSLTKCKQILNKKGIFYTDEEVVILRDVLYKIAEIEYCSYKEKSAYSKNCNTSQSL